ncbi:hypothetical protein [Fodinibius sp. Rm-B-1B1-1]|uniref:hypothetical protein n=1 Tax=Fodinibius alkaliphilus TaxID=3140241 RepID=UPI00315B1F06
MKQTEEDFFQDLISQSKLTVPDSDFEDKVMMHIQEAKATQQESIPSGIKMSWVLFTLTVILGVVNSLLLHQMQTFALGISPSMAKTVFDFLLILFVIMQLDTLLRATFRYTNINLVNQLRRKT